ncbi:hypothetical protein RCL1_005586 [Eukaryota sp. TZLM3-RCL]
MSTPMSSATTSRPAQPPFTIKKWNAVALWSWDVQTDTCAICKNENMQPCLECFSANPDTTEAVECPIAWGTCNHVFHYHCISRWLKTRQVCPLDNQPWELRKLSSENEAT